ncbi:MAG: hypothetical protein H6934_03290 [Burkholderiaceae bacterium]|nr:hypothetical protein [Burkholderiaceae bacterium]
MASKEPRWQAHRPGALPSASGPGADIHGLVLRELGPDDLARLRLAQFPAADALDGERWLAGVLDDTTDRWGAMCQRASARFGVFTDDSISATTAVGLGTCLPVLDTSIATIGILVFGAFRQHRVGSSLMAVTLDAAAQAGYIWAEVSAHEDDEALRALARRFDFRDDPAGGDRRRLWRAISRATRFTAGGPRHDGLEIDRILPMVHTGDAHRRGSRRSTN